MPRATAWTLLLAEAVACPAQAEDRVYDFDIPAGPLGTALSRFSASTGMSVGTKGATPAILVPRVAGRLTSDVALRRLLAGSGLRARRVGSTYRIERDARRQRPAERPAQAHTLSPPPAVPETAPQSDIVVTAQKRREALAAVPFSLSVVPGATLASGASTLSHRDLSLRIEGLAATNLGSGRNRLFIRGIADSPFNGKSQTTVAVQIDETRVTYDAPNPDLRLVDVERVEVLKGPQGPLYGSGALGGIYHVVTRRPELGTVSGALRLLATGVEHGGIEGGVEGVVNLPVLADTLAVRAVGYRVIEPGWIDNIGGRRNHNATKTDGVRLAARWRPAADWTTDLTFTWQDIDARDSQYVLAGDPGLRRENRIAEPTDNDLRLVQATVEGRLGAVRLLGATSLVEQGFDYVLDASGAAAAFGLAGSVRFDDVRDFRLFNQELRLHPADGTDWLIGLSYLRANTHGRSTLVDGGGRTLVLETLRRRSTELALFGEISRPLVGPVNGTVGARLFRSMSRDRTRDQSDGRSQLVLSPSLSLSLPLDDKGIAYLRYARATRPGGLASVEADGVDAYQSDGIATLDLGFRHGSAADPLSFAVSGYHSDWARVQSDYLLANGLISTRNAGRAEIFGLEGGLDWRVGGGSTLSVGGAAQHAVLTHTQDGSDIADRRMPVVPAFTARAAIAQQLSTGDWDGELAVQANYTGASRLSLDADLDRRMGEYVDLAFRARLAEARWALGFTLDNLLDVRGDSFAFGNPFTIRQRGQVTPLRPRTLLFSVTRHW